MRKQAQDAGCKVRVPGEHLEAGDQAVTAEQGGVPGDPSAKQPLIVKTIDEQASVEKGALDRRIEQRIVAVESSRCTELFLVGAPCLSEPGLGRV